MDETGLNDWEVKPWKFPYELPSGEYWIGDAVPFMPDALYKRFTSLVDANMDGVLFYLGAHPMYCRIAGRGPGEYTVRTPIPPEPNYPDFRVDTVTLAEGYLCCLPRAALLALNSDSEDSGIRFTAIDTFRPHYWNDSHIFDDATVAVRSDELPDDKDEGEFLSRILMSRWTY